MDNISRKSQMNILKFKKSKNMFSTKNDLKY